VPAGRAEAIYNDMPLSALAARVEAEPIDPPNRSHLSLPLDIHPALIHRTRNRNTLMSHIVIVGAGPTGTATARQLAPQGHRVTVVTRTGDRSLGDGIERVSADATDSAALTAICRGANAVINCANPPYTTWATSWPPLASSFLEAAQQSGAALITMSNLYGYGPVSGPMHAMLADRATGANGKVRAQMWADAKAAHDTGRIRAVEVRASDFFGPDVTDSSIGQRVVPRILAGKNVQFLGDLDVPHSYTYAPDAARVLATLAESADHDDTLFGRTWLVPSIDSTQRAMVEAIAAASDVAVPKMSTMGPWFLNTIGTVVPIVRALKEVRYQFTEPFIIDATETTAATRIAPTDTEAAIASTVAWWRAQESKPR